MVTAGGGWTIIQRRLDGSVDFYRGWDDYKLGFGDKSGEYWLGLDLIHEMTSRRKNRLRVDLQDFEGNTRYAEYDIFFVDDETSKYKLTIGNYSGSFVCLFESANILCGVQIDSKRFYFEKNKKKILFCQEIPMMV